MTDTAPASAGDPDEATSLPLENNLNPALALLRHAYDCAQDAHAPSWDFALEIGKLYEAGLTITDLRWLVVKGLVEHGGETSVYGDSHRSFMRSDGFNFLDTTCVVLTKKGAGFASQVLRAPAPATAAPPGGEKKTPSGGDTGPTDGEARLDTALKPRWDPARRELSLDGQMVKRFRVPAPNQELILSVFQEEGWPEGIDDPLPGNDDIDPRTRLNDVIYRLNHAQVRDLIHFNSNGDGKGVHWSLPGPKPRRRCPGAAKKPLAVG